MIPRTVPSCQTKHWQEEMKSLIRTPEELFQILQLDPALLPQSTEASTKFELRVPRPYAARIRPGDIDDPLLRQVLPLAHELQNAPGYTRDPLAEKHRNPIPGLVHKYKGRVLLVVAGHCAVNCRYCFRRHFDYQQNTPGREGWLKVLDYLKHNSDITEVIFSGGDPLASSDRQLSWLTGEIEAIPHIRRLRLHTRLPVMIPSRIDSQCLSWISQTRLKVVLVLHANHANELDSEVADAMAKLAAAGVCLLNQSVLLRGVNDSLDSLIHLSERLFELDTHPYYLHLLDKVAGAAHFEVSEAEGVKLMAGMLKSLPGYLIPRLVREVPGANSKIPVSLAQEIANCDICTNL